MSNCYSGVGRFRQMKKDLRNASGASTEFFASLINNGGVTPSPGSNASDDEEDESDSNDV